MSEVDLFDYSPTVTHLAYKGIRFNIVKCFDSKFVWEIFYGDLENDHIFSSKKFDKFTQADDDVQLYIEYHYNELKGEE